MRYQTVIVMSTIRVCASFVELGRIRPSRAFPRLASRSVRTWSTKSQSESPSQTIESVAIVGGGLAGLSTAYSLLNRNTNQTIPSNPLQITILDIQDPGCGGASAVAGGLLHPFSPRGKLVYLGKEGLDASNALIKAALRHEPNCILRESIYRIANNDKTATQLRETSMLHPEYSSWLDAAEIQERCGTPSEGGLVLSNGCRVVHVPTYLVGLWKACQELSGGTAKWVDSRNDWKERLSGFDAVVLSAGAGLFQNNLVMEDIPAMLVRGQSIEMVLDDDTNSPPYPNEAVLCGKYMTPTPNGVLIGATHEYKPKVMNATQVYNDLRQRSEFLPVWESGYEIDKITSGVRVQSQRGKLGRLPMIGKLTTDVHENAWLFTGLSSRGLIHHGVLGKVLSDALLTNDESVISQDYPELLWWKKEKAHEN